MFKTALHIIAKNCKQPKCPSTGKQINYSATNQWNTTQQ